MPTPDERPDPAETGRTADDSRSGRISRRTVLSTLGAGVALGGAAVGWNGALEDAVTDLVASDGLDNQTVSSGEWTDASTWERGVPADVTDATIRAEHTVTLAGTTDRVKNLVVEGTLTVDPTRDSHLQAETVVTRSGSRLAIGTESAPVDPGVRSQVTVVHHEDIGEKDDPERVSKGLIVRGDIEVHGAEKTAWDELATEPTAGTTTLELATEPTGWQVGDELVLPGQNPHFDQPEDEERTIASIDGATVTLDRPLEYDHTPPENNLERSLSAYVLNLSRNVVFESEVKETDPTREKRINRQGHVMIMSPATSVNYARFIHVGRTNKRYYGTDPKWSEVPDEGRYVPDEPNPIARYAFHYHETGIGEDPHRATGLVAQDSPGWGIVNHHSHAHVEDCITYRVLGSGFSAEAGDERGTFTRCFALRSRGSGEFVPDSRSDLRKDPDALGVGQTMEFGFEGIGFWLQGPAVAVDDCVAAGHRNFGFKLWAQALFDGQTYTSDDFHFSGHDDTFEHTANFPVHLAKADGIMPEEAYYDSLPGGTHHDGLVSILYLTLRSFGNNTAFACGGGFQYGGSIEGPPTDDREHWPTVESFTGYNVTRIIDSDGEPVGHRGKNLYGDGGNAGISSYRYADKMRVTDAQLSNVGYPEATNHRGDYGVTHNHYAAYLSVEDSTIEGFEKGVQLADTVSSSRFRNLTLDNDWDVRGGWRERHTGLEMANLSSTDGDLDIELTRHVTPEPLDDLTDDVVAETIDDRRIYYEMQDPDVVPFETRSDLEEHVEDDANLADRVEAVFGTSDPDALVGETNSELHAAFGTCVYGEPTPDGAVERPYLEHGTVLPFTVDHSYPTVREFTFQADQTLDGDGSTTYEWEFGDGASATGEVVTHTYATEGEYTVALTRTAPDGHSVTETASVAVGASEQSPYGRDSPWPVPGRVQAEDFDEGGPGVAYEDDSGDNEGGEYRDEGVDVEPTGDDTGTYNVGWMRGGEWLEYTVAVDSRGTYDVDLRVARPHEGGAPLAVRVDGTAVGTATVPSTGDWQEYTTVTVPDVELAAGPQVVRLTVPDIGGDAYNLNWFEISPASSDDGAGDH